MLRAAEPAKPHLVALRKIGLAAEANGLDAEPWFRVGADFGAVLELLEGLVDDLGRPELAEASNGPT